MNVQLENYNGQTMVVVLFQDTPVNQNMRLHLAVEDAEKLMSKLQDLKNFTDFKLNKSI
jgi:hypothetical protein